MASYSLTVSSGENLINGVTYSASRATIGSGAMTITVSLSCSGGAWSSNTPYVYSVTVNTTGGALSGTGSTYITSSSGGTAAIMMTSNFGSTVTITSIYAVCTSYPTNSSYPNGYSGAWGGSISIESGSTPTPPTPTVRLNPPYNLRLSCNGITDTEIYVQPGASVTLSWRWANGMYIGSDFVAAESCQIWKNISGYGYIGTEYTYATFNLTASTEIGSRIGYYMITKSNPSGYDSIQSEYVYINVISNALSAPTNVRLDDSIVSPSDTTTLRWNAVNKVANNTVLGYTIYKNGVAIGTENNTTAYVVTANTSGGQSDVFTVVANGSVSDSPASSGVTLSTCTNPTAPTAVLSNSAIDPDTDVTLSWSGASAGSSNPITGYEIYKKIGSSGSYSKLGNTLGTDVSSYTVRSSATQGEVYYFKVRVLGTVRNSYSDSAELSLTSYIYEQVGAPSTVTINPDTAPYGGSATLTWGSGIDRTYVTVVGYDVYRCNTINGTYEKIGSTIIGNSTTVYAPNSDSYYKIKSIASVPGYDSDLSVPSAKLTLNLSPTVPTGFSVTPAEYNAGLVTFTWNASTDPEGDTIHYKIEMSYNNTVTQIATDLSNTIFSIDMTNTIDRGTSATFYVYAYDSLSSSEPSQGVILTRVDIPSSNDIELVNYIGNVCYSQYPKLIYKAKRRLIVSVNGNEWLISNSSLIGRNEYFILTCVNRQVPASTNPADNISMSLTMTITDEFGNVGSATQTFTVALPDYTTDPAITNTYVKASHMNNLRTIVSTHYKFMTSVNYPDWTSGLIVAGDTSLGLWMTHVYELRSCIEAIINVLNKKIGRIAIQAPTWIVLSQNIPNASAMNQIWTFIRDTL